MLKKAFIDTKSADNDRIDYAEIVFRVCKSYNNAAVLVEINDIGEQVATSLHFDFEYDNVLFTESAGRSGKRITSGFGGNIDKGIRTTKPVKSVGCSLMKLLIEQNQFIVNDFHLLITLFGFDGVLKNGIRIPSMGYNKFFSVI